MFRSLIVRCVLGVTLLGGMCSSSASAGQWNEDSYAFSVEGTILTPSNDPDARGVSYSANYSSSWTNTAEASAMMVINTRRAYSWQGPGWPTQLTVHFSAPVTGRGQGSSGGATVQARRGEDMNLTSLSTGAAPLDEIDQTFSFPDVVKNNTGAYTAELYHVSSTAGSYASASVTAVIVK